MNIIFRFFVMHIQMKIVIKKCFMCGLKLLWCQKVNTQSVSEKIVKIQSFFQQQQEEFDDKTVRILLKNLNFHIENF